MYWFRANKNPVPPPPVRGTHVLEKQKYRHIKEMESKRQCHLGEREGEGCASRTTAMLFPRLSASPKDKDTQGIVKTANLLGCSIPSETRTSRSLEAGESKFQGLPWVNSEFQVRLSYMTTCLKKNQREKVPKELKSQTHLPPNLTTGILALGPEWWKEQLPKLSFDLHTGMSI